MRRRTSMKAIAEQIDRDGEYRQPEQQPTVECDHCHALKVLVKDGLCVTCRRVLGLLHADSFHNTDGGRARPDLASALDRIYGIEG